MREVADKIVTIRKGRKCSWCCRDFPAGSRMRRMVGFEGPEFRSAYYCADCQRELFAGTCYEQVGAGSWEMI